MDDTTNQFAVHSINIVVVGAEGVGKSSITIYKTLGLFIEEYDPTFQNVYKISIRQHKTLFCLNILDTAGACIMRNQSLIGGEGFIVVYSITDENSFDEMQNILSHILALKEVDFVPMVIVGNKCDLELDRKVQTKAGENVAEKHRAAFFETSAKFGINVDEAFEPIINELIQKKMSEIGIKIEEKKACVVC